MSGGDVPEPGYLIVNPSEPFTGPMQFLQRRAAGHGLTHPVPIVI